MKFGGLGGIWKFNATSSIRALLFYWLWISTALILSVLSYSSPRLCFPLCFFLSHSGRVSDASIGFGSCNPVGPINIFFMTQKPKHCLVRIRCMKMRYFLWQWSDTFETLFHFYLENFNIYFSIFCRLYVCLGLMKIFIENISLV